MYSPQSFSLDDITAQSELISRYPLGLLISNTPQGIEANQLPFLVDVDANGVMTLRAQRPEPWQISDAPDNFIASMLTGIIGIELVVHRVVGKAKLGQNRSAEDVAGVANGLYQTEGQSSQLAAAMKKAKDLL